MFNSKEWRQLVQFLLLLLFIGLAAAVNADCKPAKPTSLAPAAKQQLLVVSQNMWLFHDENKNFQYDKAIPAKVVAKRIVAYADYIINRLGSPHLLALQEVENKAILERLTKAIGELGGPNYFVALLPNQDVAGNTVALLYREPVELGRVSALFRHHVIEGTRNSKAFARLPLLAEVKRPLKMKVLVVHLRSGHGLNDAKQRNYVMRKRRSEAQALIQWARQQSGHYLIVGDFNTAEGTGDYSQTWSMFKQAGWLAAQSTTKAKNYTYQFQCKKEQLDQIFYSSSLGDYLIKTDFAHGNAGRFRELYNDQGTSVLSDHDAIGVYLRADATAL